MKVQNNFILTKNHNQIKGIDLINKFKKPELKLDFINDFKDYKVIKNNINSCSSVSTNEPNSKPKEKSFKFNNKIPDNASNENLNQLNLKSLKSNSRVSFNFNIDNCQYNKESNLELYNKVKLKKEKFENSDLLSFQEVDKNKLQNNSHSDYNENNENNEFCLTSFDSLENIYKNPQNKIIELEEIKNLKSNEFKGKNEIALRIKQLSMKKETKQYIQLNDNKLNLNLELANKTNEAQIPFEYISDIFSNLKQEEISQSFKASKNISSKRAVIVDWLIDVSEKFKLTDETYFLTLQIFDRYILNNKDNLQLIASSCLSIACKYEEIFSPEIKDFVYITDSSYSKEEILAKELDILKNLKFGVTFPSCLKFFEIYSLFCGYKEKDFSNNSYNDFSFKQFKILGVYLMQLFSIDNKFNLYLPSIIALSVVSICYRIKNIISLIPCESNNYNKTILLPNELMNLLNLDQEEEIKKCYIDILFNLKYSNLKENSFKTIVEKFSKKKYLWISQLKALNIEI